jgi:hypothetical protein
MPLEPALEHSDEAAISRLFSCYGDSLLQRIGHAIDKSGHLLACISPTSVNSAWVQRELEIALTSDIAGKLNVIPVLLADSEMPAFLRGRLYYDARPPNQLVSE